MSSPLRRKLRGAWFGLLLVGCGPSTDAQDPSEVAPIAQVAPAPAPVVPPPSTQTSTASPVPSSPPSASSAAPAQSAPVVMADPGPADPEETKALAAMSDTQRPVFLAVKVCTEQALKKNEEPKGSLAIELTIAADGSVASMKLGPGYPPGMRACVESRVRAIAFPKGASARFVRFPINESPP